MIGAVAVDDVAPDDVGWLVDGRDRGTRDDVAVDDVAIDGRDRGTRDDVAVDDVAPDDVGWLVDSTVDTVLDLPLIAG